MTVKTLNKTKHTILLLLYKRFLPFCTQKYGWLKNIKFEELNSQVFLQRELTTFKAKNINSIKTILIFKSDITFEAAWNGLKLLNLELSATFCSTIFMRMESIRWYCHISSFDCQEAFFIRSRSVICRMGSRLNWREYNIKIITRDWETEYQKSNNWLFYINWIIAFLLRLSSRYWILIYIVFLGLFF